MSVLYQLLWKFCGYLYLGFAALLPKHHLPHAIIQILYSLRRRNQFPSNFCVCSYIFCNVDMLPAFYHSSSSTSTIETVYKIYVGIFVICRNVNHFDYDHTATKHSYTRLASVQAGI